MLYYALLNLRMTYNGTTTGSLSLLTPDDNQKQILKVDLRCNVDSDLDSLVTFVDSNLLVPTTIEAITAKGNYEYDTIREIADNVELNSLLSLLDSLNQD